MIDLIKVTTKLNQEENMSIEIETLIFINQEENMSIEIRNEEDVNLIYNETTKNKIETTKNKTNQQ